MAFLRCILYCMVFSISPACKIAETEKVSNEAHKGLPWLQAKFRLWLIYVASFLALSLSLFWPLFNPFSHMCPSSAAIHLPVQLKRRSFKYFPLLLLLLFCVSRFCLHQRNINASCRHLRWFARGLQCVVVVRWGLGQMTHPVHTHTHSWTSDSCCRQLCARESLV